MKAYRDLLQDVLDNGQVQETRRVDPKTGQKVRTLSVFGRQFRHDLEDGFPATTGKRLFWKGVAVELLWFLRGETNIQYLLDQDVHIWDEWADENGELGPVYGRQWRALSTSAEHGPAYVDQLQNMYQDLLTRGTDRDLIVSAWNPADIPAMAIPPCHALFQMQERSGKLYCHMFQRSADIFLGVPFNIASYALLTHLMAKEVGLRVGELVISYSDIHLYENHLDGANEYLNRRPRTLPTLEITGNGTLFQPNTPNYQWTDFKLIGYDPHPTIRGEVAI